MSGVFTFDEAAHEYRLDGRKLPSVTSIIRPIAPDFSAIPPHVLERKRAIGTAAHLACELDDLGELDEESLDPILVGYLQAWRGFKDATGAIVIANERRLYHPRLNYAGTLDRLLSIGGNLWLVDLKTSADPVPSYGVQLAAYAELLKASDAQLVPQEPRRASLHLRDDGTHKLHEFKNPNDWPAFVACLSLYQWKESNQ